MGGREPRWTERPARRAIKNAFVVLSTNYSCVVVEEGFVTFPHSAEETGQQETSFCNPTDWGEAGETTLPAGSLFLVLLGMLLPPLTVIICVCLPPASFLGRRKGIYLASGQTRHVNDIQTRHSEAARRR